MSKNKINNTCPLCKKKGYDIDNLPLHLYCRSCKFAWLKKYPKPSYEENYYKGGSGVASKLFFPIALFFNILRSSYVGYDRKQLWIDVGAGDGSFLKTVRSENKIGVDISLSARRIMKKCGISTMTDRQFINARKLNADVISFWHMLEHVSNPLDYLKAAKHNLSSKGLLVIGLPSIDCLEYHLFGNSWFHTPKFHLWENSPHSISILLKKTGFKIKSIDYWSLEHHLPNVLQSFINFSAGSQGALHRLIRRGHDSTFTGKDAFWSLFWLTLGLPVILLYWVIGALTQKSSTIVVVSCLS